MIATKKLFSNWLDSLKHWQIHPTILLALIAFRNLSLRTRKRQRVSWPKHWSKVRDKSSSWLTKTSSRPLSLSRLVMRLINMHWRYNRWRKNTLNFVLPYKLPARSANSLLKLYSASMQGWIRRSNDDNILLVFISILFHTLYKI